MFFKEFFDNQVAVRITVSIVIVLVTILVWFIVSRSLKAYRIKKNDGNPIIKVSSTKSVILDTIKVGIFTFIILVILEINGVNVTSLLAGLGVAGAVVGLALQDFLKDIIMGTHILMDSFFEIGDLVEFRGEQGVVEEFNLRTTKLRSIDDDDIITICNRNIDQISKKSNQIYIHIPLPYELKAAEADEAIREMVDRVGDSETIKEAEYLGTTDFESSYVDYLVLVEASKPELWKRSRREFLRIVQDVLLEKNISVPFDQIDVHMK